MNNQNKTTIHINIDKDILSLFDKCYPHSRSRFISNALELASSDKALFERIFFKALLDTLNTI